MLKEASTSTSNEPNGQPINQKTIILDKGDVETKRQEILDYFHTSFSLYESIFECLNGDEAFYSLKSKYLET